MHGRGVAIVILASLALAAAALTAPPDTQRARPAPTRAVRSLVPARTPRPPALARAQLERQDRVDAAQRRREGAALDRRALLAHLPLALAGVTIDIAGLGADGRTTMLELDAGGRSRAYARAIYARALRTYGDSGRAYETRLKP
jgi:hypothetical protein